MDSKFHQLLAYIGTLRNLANDFPEFTMGGNDIDIRLQCDTYMDGEKLWALLEAIGGDVDNDE